MFAIDIGDHKGEEAAHDCAEDRHTDTIARNLLQTSEGGLWVFEM